KMITSKNAEAGRDGTTVRLRSRTPYADCQEHGLVMKKWRACRLLRMASLSESCLDEQRYSSISIIRATLEKV
ncbi:MAG: hypothetical protein K6F46_09040, partial [Desulfovibrio sp.]|nr:hypothetical protein [Desulfovibrio sp.]